MNDISLERNRKEDDDDDIVIIENPNPKLKPPLIILCETSDDDEEQESRDISLNNGLARPVVIEIGSEPESDPIWSNTTSKASCSKAASSNINPLPDYIPLECSPGSSSTNCPNNELNGSSSPKATCPECRAELFSLKMLHRHIQFRHPNIFEHSTTPELQNTNCQRNVNASQQRFKLNPLRSPLCTGTMMPGSTVISNASTCTLNRSNQEPPKIAPLPSLVYRRIGGVSQGNKATATATSTTISGTSMETDNIDMICQPLKVVIYSPSSEQDGNGRYVQRSPLPIDKQTNTTKKILDNGNENKTVDFIELLDISCRDPDAVTAVNQATRKNQSKKSSCESGPPPCKRKRQDPLLLLVEDDDHEQEISTRPASNKKKDMKGKRIPVNGAFTCNVHRKTFSTQSALLQHYRAKHPHDTITRRERKPKKSYSLRSRNNINVPPFLSSTPPSMEKLKMMKHIIMIDIDNWQKIFESDLTFSPSTFVWGFQGGSTAWKPPVTSSLLKNLKQMNCFYLHPKCGKSKDAADFALCVQAGKLDVLLPKDIIFTVLSGDKGFNELQNQLSLSKREVHIVNPHHKTIDTVLTILNSIADR